MIIDKIKTSATSVGINAVVLNSDENLKVQLNRLTTRVKLPIMLISWDIRKPLVFNDYGKIKEPYTRITTLLLNKSDMTANDSYNVAESMGELFILFLEDLNASLLPELIEGKEPIKDASMRLQVLIDSHKHSGVLAEFTVLDPIGVHC